MAIAGIGFAATSFAAPISVPNGDFSNSANNGQIGGGLIGSSGTNVAIGSGPWQGTYHGILGFLAPPKLTITTGSATISGLVGINALGIVDNGGYFSQTLTTAFLADHHYVLAADVDVGTTLSASILSNGNAGIALLDGGTALASTQTAPAGDISITLLTGTLYQLVLTYDTGPSVTGNVGIALLALPQHVAKTDVLKSVTFRNVTLSASELNPTPASVVTGGGTPQGTTVNTAFPTPFSVTVLDAEGDPVSGVTVTFNPPASGAGVTLSAATAITDASGHAQVTGIANGTAGSYTLSASVPGVVDPAEFSLTNLAAAASNVDSSTGTPQSTAVNTAFGTSLGVTVTDASNNPVAGITVTFTAPGSGASASFSSGNTAITDINGYAEVPASANTVAGEYAVTASVSGTSSTASFELTNTAGSAALAVPASGTPQSAMVATPFGTPMVVTITDVYGNPVSGVPVTFTAPALGASATLAECFTGSSTTDSNGEASICGTANGIVGGPYDVSASAPGVDTNAVFVLTNTLISVVGTPSGGAQTATVNGSFLCSLKLTVTDGDSNPLALVDIEFVAPNSGASATLYNGLFSGTTLDVLTDLNGTASVTAVANATAGSYVVSAGVAGSGISIATYPMTNLAAGDRIFEDGFEGNPPACN